MTSPVKSEQAPVCAKEGATSGNHGGSIRLKGERIFVWDGDNRGRLGPDRRLDGDAERAVRRQLHHGVLSVLLAAGLGGIGNLAHSAGNEAGADPGATTNVNGSLAEMKLEDLLQVEVTSVTKMAAPLSESPAAIYVVTPEDMRRNGVLSVPEALRQVPGLEVARIDSGGYAVSARGMNARLNRQLLVLIDGRSVYSQLNSGVAWESLDVMIEDLDRIEVIRGPGATLFGANAVNGVINIVTKKAKDTQGLLLTGGGGTATLGYGGLRYGGRLATNAYYRIYGTYLNRDATGAAASTAPASGGHGVPGNGQQPGSSTGQTPDPTSGSTSNSPPGSEVDPRPEPSLRDNPADFMENGLGGVRVDWEATPTDLVTFQGDYFAQTYQYPLSAWQWNRNQAANYLQRWDHTFSDESAMTWQLYYDHVNRNTEVFREVRHTGDVDFQHNFTLGQRQRWLWGAGYRYTTDEVTAAPEAPVYFDPPSAAKQTFSAFVQDEITVVEKRLKTTLGTKLEHNDFTGFEIQPGLRTVYTPAEQHVIWGAISRAARTPSREEFDLVAASSRNVIVGNPELASEELTAYELGYRFLPKPNLTLDLATYYNVYDRMRTIETVRTIGGIDYVSSRNNGYGETYGAEISATWRPLDQWRLTASYTALMVQMHQRPGVVNPGFETVEGNTPHHQAQFHSYWDLPGHFEFDQGLYYVDNVPNQNVAAYTRLDLGLGWRPSKHFEARLSFQNVARDSHYEFGNGSSSIERAVFGQITVRF